MAAARIAVEINSNNNESLTDEDLLNKWRQISGITRQPTQWKISLLLRFAAKTWMKAEDSSNPEEQASCFTSLIRGSAFWHIGKQCSAQDGDI